MSETMIEKHCLHCGKLFSVRLAIHKVGYGKFCPGRCKYDYRTRPPEERFWDNVQITTECWPWIGLRDKDGYGILYLRVEKQPNGSRRIISTRVHRWVLEKWLGRELKEGMLSCHKCNSPSCCRPDHLYEGTDTENNRQARKEGRHKQKRGSYNRMTEETVKNVKALLSTHTNKRIAQMFNSEPTTISNIRTRKTWKEVV